MDFKTRLRELRQENDLTQKDLAKKINSTDKNIWAYEHGVFPTIETLISLADFFEVSVDYLLGRNDDFKLGIIPNDIFAAEERELVELYRSFSPIIKNTTLEAMRAWAGMKSSQIDLHKKV